MVCCILSTPNGSKLLRTNGQVYHYTRHSSEIMAKLCEAYAVSFHAGRLISAQLLNIRQKPPVCISLIDEWIFFPTSGYQSDECHWLNYRYIQEIKPLGPRKTLVVFRRGLRCKLNVDNRIINRQMDRCKELLERKIDYEKFERD